MKNKTMYGMNGIAALLIMLLGAAGICMVVGGLVSGQIMPEVLGRTACWILVEITVLCVCYFAVRKLPKGRLVGALVLALAFCLLRVLLGAVLFSGEKMLLHGCLVTLGMGIVAGLMSGMKKQRRR